MPTFVPPTSGEWTFAEGENLDPSERRYWSHYGTQPRGQTVIRTGGVWATRPYPTLAQIDDADSITDPNGLQVDAVFLGGHVYSVTQAIADELTAAGYVVS